MSSENMFNAAMVMYKAGEEIDAMLEKLFALLVQKLETLKDVRKIVPERDQYNESSDWVYTDIVRNFGIYRKGARTPSAYLAFQIKLCDNKEADIVGSQPLFYVLFSAGSDWELDEFLLHKAVSEGFVLEGDCLWQRYDEDEDRSQIRSWWKEAECAFAVPLVDLNTPEDLRAIIVEPINSLMTSGLDPINLDHRVLRFEVKNSEVRLSS